ncbi:MAG: PorT family protein [Deltaproteobacteria bacterium]|nr:MAG: PorT family protein [Deltaproteobacteria bacterium]
MKNLLAVIAVALAVVFTLSPASVYAKGVSIGAKGGLNLANLKGSDVDAFTDADISFGDIGTITMIIDPEEEKKKAASFGVFVTYYINDYFAVQPEFLYSMKGIRGKRSWVEPWYGPIYDNDMTITYEQTISLNYLEIPLLAKVSIPMGKSLKHNMFFGPAMGIITSAKREYEITGMSEELKQIYEMFDIPTSGEEDIEDMRSVDFGLVFGLGLDFKLGPGNAVIDARYTLGLINIIKEISIDYSFDPALIESPDVKNSVISIMAGYSFSL